MKKNTYLHLFFATGIYFIAVSVLAQEIIQEPVIEEPIIVEEKITENLDFLASTPEEKASLKADAIIADTVYPSVVNFGDLSIEIESIEKIEGGVQVFVRAFDGVEQLGFGADGSVDIERIRIFNPPILVHDNLGDIVKEYEDVDGKLVSYTLREDPNRALDLVLRHTIEKVGKRGTEIIPDKVGNTTSVFYPYADGRVYRSTTNESFSTIRTSNGNGNDTGGSGYNIPLLAAGGTSNLYDGMNKGIYSFDTSAIPDTDTINSGTVSFASNNKGDYFCSSVGITEGGGTVSSIATSDYENSLSTSRYNTADITIASWNTAGTYNDFTLSATGTSAIDATGYTKIAVRLNCDIDNTSPSGWSAGQTAFVHVFNVEEGGTASDPKLTIVHSSAGGGATSTATTTTTTVDTDNIVIALAFLQFGLFFFGFLFYLKRTK